MNFKPLVITKIKQFSKEFPEYTFGQMLYSILSKENFKLSTLLDLDDEELYSMVERSIKKEQND